MRRWLLPNGDLKSDLASAPDQDRWHRVFRKAARHFCLSVSARVAMRAGIRADGLLQHDTDILT